MEANPGQAVLASDQVFVKGLVLMPQDDYTKNRHEREGVRKNSLALGSEVTRTRRLGGSGFADRSYLGVASCRGK